MPQNLNRVPAGLLSLFQIKEQGQNPNLLDDNVTPALEMENFYLTAIGLSLEIAQEAGVAFADLASNVATITIPDNEIWVVKALESNFTTTTAGTGLTLVTPTIRNINGNPNQISFVLNNYVSNTIVCPPQVNGSDHWPIYFDNPLYLPGGVLISSYVSNFVGTGVGTVDTRCLYYRIEK